MKHSAFVFYLSHNIRIFTYLYWFASVLLELCEVCDTTECDK